MAMFQKRDRVRVRGIDEIGEVLGTVLTTSRVPAYLVKLDDGTTGQYVEPLLDLQPQKPTQPVNEGAAR